MAEKDAITEDTGRSHGMKSTATATAKSAFNFFELLFLFSEILVVIFFLSCTEYSAGMHPAATSTQSAAMMAKDKVRTYYPVFQDVHVMIFIGFGFLMVFLKTHSWTSVGFNFLIAAYVLQIGILITAFWHMVINSDFHKVPLDITSLIVGDFAAGAVLISFGAVLGKCSLSQLWCLATMEVVFYGLNEAIGAGILGAVDMGGSMYVHTFGAYFGLAATYFFDNKKALEDKKGKCGGSYNSQLIAMVGTIYLWMFWPSFNGALAADWQQQRVIVNTVMAISASCITACAMSRIILQRLDMEVLLNATLAGGVAVGSSSDLVVSGGTAMAIGALAGVVSALGFLKLSGFLQVKIKLHDTCGVNNLHGIPGLIGGIFGAISVGTAGNSFDQAALEATFPKLAEGRTISGQALTQVAALCITLVIAVLGGCISGFVASRFGKLNELFDDKENFCHVEFPDAQDEAPSETIKEIV